ncbi:MAG: PadR family transcriptional regulator [Nanoarchaeota archaeon]
MVIKQVTSLSNHCLHLCNDSNIEEIVFSYLIDADVFVTNNIEAWEKKFDEKEIECAIKKPDEIEQNMKIVVDGSSLGNDFEKLEERWKKQEKAICIYNIDKIDPSILKDLVIAHNKMLLSVDKIRMLSDKNLEKEIEELNPEIVENLVKRELKNVVLSMLLTRPMSGTDLVKLLYSKFKVFVSPGMLYPTLHELEKKGLLKYEYKLKNKVYSVHEKEQAELLLKKHVKVNSLLSEFLVSK